MTITHQITYRKLESNEKIQPWDMHSLSNGAQLLPIANPKETIGQTPADFSKERTWWRPIESKVIEVKE